MQRVANCEVDAGRRRLVRDQLCESLAPLEFRSNKNRFAQHGKLTISNLIVEIEFLWRCQSRIVLRAAGSYWLGWSVRSASAHSEGVRCMRFLKNRLKSWARPYPSIEAIAAIFMGVDMLNSHFA